MDQNPYTTDRRKCQHLSYKERCEIEIRLNEGWTKYQIAKWMNLAYNTVKNEVRRGTVTLGNGQQVYRAEAGQEVYKEHRMKCRRPSRFPIVTAFLQYVNEHMKRDGKSDQGGWSPDACVGRALASGQFRRDETVCTKTLYNYIDLGLLPVKNIDLLEKTSRNTKKKKRIRENKRKLGKSIEERPEIIDKREEFGHWELDSVIGTKKQGEPVIITLTERKLRVCIWLIAHDHSAEAVNEVLRELFAKFGDKWKEVFKSITTDNGSEFTLLSEFEKEGVQIYFTHPYTSCEKGTNECHNRMLRRFVPKGKSIADYSVDDICFFADCINGLPRKLLGYRTPDELFEEELDRIYAA